MSGETPVEFETKNKNRSWADVVSKQDAAHLPPEREESASVPRQAESVSDMSEITAELDSIKGQIIGLTGLPAAHLKNDTGRCCIIFETRPNFRKYHPTEINEEYNTHVQDTRG